MLRYSYILLVICYIVGFVVFGTSAGWVEDYTAIINDENNKDFLNSLNKLKHDFEAYNFEVDRAIPWKELKASMEALDLLRVNYNGAATDDLIGVQETTATLMNEYRLATNEMYRWAVTGRERFNFIVRNKHRLNNMRRIKMFTEEILNSGKSTIQSTLDKLNDISSRLITLESKLKRIKSTIMSELDQHNAAFAEYETKRAEFNANLEADRARAQTQLADCENRKRMAEEAAKKADTLSWIIRGINALVNVVVKFASGPIGKALGLGLKGSATALLGSKKTPDTVSCGDIAAEFEKLKLTQPMPSKEEEKAVLNEFYFALGNALEDAIHNVTAVKRAVDEEVNYVEKLQGKVTEMAGRSIVIKEEDIDIYGDFIIPDLETMALSLDDYVKRHSGGFVFVDFESSRRNRRGLMSPMAELQMEYAELKENIEAQLNATEKERNERFWILNYGTAEKQSVLQIEPFLKFGILV